MHLYHRLFHLQRTRVADALISSPLPFTNDKSCRCTYIIASSINKSQELQIHLYHRLFHLQRTRVADALISTPLPFTNDKSCRCTYINALPLTNHKSCRYTYIIASSIYKGQELQMHLYHRLFHLQRTRVADALISSPLPFNKSQELQMHLYHRLFHLQMTRVADALISTPLPLTNHKSCRHTYIIASSINKSQEL